MKIQSLTNTRLVLALLAVSMPGNPAALSPDFEPLPADRLRPVID